MSVYYIIESVFEPIDFLENLTFVISYFGSLGLLSFADFLRIYSEL